MSRDIERLLGAIRRMKAEYPEWRIGQLVANVADWKLGPDAKSIWAIEDDDFVEMVDEHLRKKSNSKRLSMRRSAHGKPLLD